MLRWCNTGVGWAPGFIIKRRPCEETEAARRQAWEDRAEIGFRLSEAKEGWDHQPLGEARTDPFPEASEGAWPC